MSEYSLLLVDDEQIIRDGISKKINWAEEGFTFLQPCEDGESAINAIQDYQPDVVITDICMPHKDGLEVARFAAENAPDTLVVILSGYEDFDYARQAVLFNVYEYVLKPLSSRKIRGLLQRIRDELSRRQAFQLDVDRLLEVQKENHLILQERFLGRVLTRTIPDTELKQYDTYLPEQDSLYDYYCSILIDLDSAESDASAVLTADLYLLALREEAEKLKERVPKMMICQTSEPSINLILFDSYKDSLLHTVRFTVEQIHKSLLLIPDFSASIGVGTAVQGIPQVHTSYKQAQRALENRMIMGGGNVFSFQESSHGITDRQNRISQIHERIMAAVKQESSDSVAKLLDDYIFLLRESGLSALRVRLEINKLAFLIIDFLGTLEDGIALKDINALSDSLASLADGADLATVEERLDSILDEISALLKENRKHYPEKKISAIQRYLESNYASQDLDVESVTTLFFISSSYLSKLFRQYTNKTFIEYLTGLRISKACELLKTSDRKLFEVAEEVGYTDQRYFSSTFKKYMGKTPSQYRNSL